MKHLNKLIKCPMSRMILTLFLSSVSVYAQDVASTGMATTHNLVSNIRVQQHGAMLHVTYDLEERADIEAFVSFDNGITYRSRPLQRVSGAVGEGVEPGTDKLLIWNVVREVGYVDFSSLVIRIVANAVISTESIAVADFSIEHPYQYHDRFYAGLTGGPNSTKFHIGLNFAYFFNRHIGAGFAVRNYVTEIRDTYIMFGRHYDSYTKSRNIFLGPVFYGRPLQTRNGKFFLSTCAGIGGVHSYYILDDTKSFILYSDNNTTSLGFFLSGGLAFRPVNSISIGLNFEYFNTFNENIFNGTDGVLLTLGLNFHF